MGGMARDTESHHELVFTHYGVPGAPVEFTSSVGILLSREVVDDSGECRQEFYPAEALTESGEPVPEPTVRHVAVSAFVLTNLETH